MLTGLWLSAKNNLLTPGGCWTPTIVPHPRQTRSSTVIASKIGAPSSNPSFPRKRESRVAGRPRPRRPPPFFVGCGVGRQATMRDSFESPLSRLRGRVREGAAPPATFVGCGVGRQPDIRDSRQHAPFFVGCGVGRQATMRDSFESPLSRLRGRVREGAAPPATFVGCGVGRQPDIRDSRQHAPPQPHRDTCPLPQPPPQPS